MREVVTTVLDSVALLLLAAGAALGLWPWLGGFALIVSGVVLLAGSQAAARTGGSG